MESGTHWGSSNGAPVLIFFGDFFIVIYFIMAYNYTQPYYNPCYPPNYNYGNHYQQRPSYPYVQHQYPGSYPQNYPAISYPGYAATNNAFTIVKSDKGDSVHALNSYDTLTIASSDTDNLIITGDKCNKKITFDLSGVVTSAMGGSAATHGEVTLAAGTATVPTSAVTATSRIFLTRTSASSTTLTVEYVVPTKTPGTSFVIQADLAAGTINVADLSTLDWFLVN